MTLSIIYDDGFTGRELGNQHDEYIRDHLRDGGRAVVYTYRPRRVDPEIREKATIVEVELGDLPVHEVDAGGQQ